MSPFAFLLLDTVVPRVVTMDAGCAGEDRAQPSLEMLGVPINRQALGVSYFLVFACPLVLHPILPHTRTKPCHLS